jgi:polar amino acid transport system substrate-binding protein
LIIVPNDLSIMPRINLISILALVVLGMVLSGSGCVTTGPSGGTPATAVPTITTPASGSIGNLTYYTEQMPPYNYIENGTLQGITIDLLEEITEQMGDKVSREQVRLVPWSEAYQAALTGNRTVIFETARIPSREALFKWAGPIYTDRDVLFARPDRGIVIHTAEDLYAYRIGAVKDDAAIPQLQEMGVNESKLVQETDASMLVSRLQSGEIDLWAYGEVQGRYFTGLVTGDPDAFRIVYTFPDVSLYYAFSRDVPDDTVEAFQQALDVLKTDTLGRGYSEYERILFRYLGAGCVRQSFSDAEVTNLVNLTVAALEENATDTLRRINAGEAPYWDTENRALYVFVYDPDLTILAQASNPQMVGVNRRGTTDVTGKPFHDELVSGAIQNGSVWVEYVYSHPVQPGLHYKTAYCRLVEGSDGKTYIVGSGNYKACGA